MSDFRPGNTKHEEGHFPEPAAVLGIAAELRCCEVAKTKKRIRAPECCKTASDDGEKAHLTP